MSETRGTRSLLDIQRAHFATGATRPPAHRRDRLQALRRTILACEPAILAAAEADLGKPDCEVYAAEVSGVLAELNHAIHQVERWSRPMRCSSPWLLFPGRACLQPEPLGTVLIISPWNYPFELTFSPLIGAVAAGNTAVLKPSELAPRSAELIGRMVAEVFPAEEVAVCTGGPEVAQALLQERWDHIFFTGGERIGREVMRAASDYLTPVTLELGGKNPTVVAVDADLRLAARRILHGRFYNAGQTCIAPDYVLVESRVSEAFLDEVQQAHRAMYGVAFSPDVARIVGLRHLNRLRELLRDGRLLCGGEVDETGCRMHPAVLVDVRPDSRVMQEEIFGPILPVLPVADLDAAVDFVNARPKPLALYLFSRDAATARRLIRRTASGGVAVNDTLVQFLNRDLPFGGVGASGFGRYHRRASFDNFTHYRSVQLAASIPETNWRYPPYVGKLNALRRLLTWLG